jgi:hypothetical protein
MSKRAEAGVGKRPNRSPLQRQPMADMPWLHSHAMALVLEMKRKITGMR